MRRVLIGFLAVFTIPAMGAYTVDIGTPASEAGYSPVGWGPVEPTTTGGTWGSITSDPGSWDNLCRVIWEPGGTPSASLTFPTAITSVDIRHLLGLADDSFDVYVDGVLWGSVTDNPSNTEVWTETTFSGTPGSTLTLTATGQQWSNFQTYGQVAIDRVVATAIPAPGALILGSLGVVMVGWVRRRRLT